MRCPSCKIETRGAERLEQGLSADQCHECGGNWLSSFQYWRWREQQSEPPSPAPPGGEVARAEDSQEALLCPECGQLLRKYRVAHDVPFRLDHCGHCGGMWFDAGEWATLREQGLHTNVHNVFTAVWQRKLRREETHETFERLYRERFGEESFGELQRIREWLYSQPQCDAMVRFLIDPDPFS